MKYPPSIVTDDLEHCYICQDTNVAIHHVFGGSYRDKSTKYGCTVALCPDHHTNTFYSVHQNNDLNIYFKRLAQKKFEELYGHELYMKEFKKNWL